MSKINSNDIAKITGIFEMFWPEKSIKLDGLLGLLKKKTYHKGDIIIETGQIEKQINFIVKGTVHMYTYVDGVQHTVSIAQRVFNSYSSYYLGIPSNETHEALTDVDILYMAKPDAEKLLKTDHAFCYIYAKLSEYILLVREQRAKLLLHKSAAKRFELFLEQHNDYMKLENEVPQKVIASYIGISPESYCRVKSQYLKNKP